MELSKCNVKTSSNCFQKSVQIKYLKDKTLINNYYIKYPINVYSVKASLHDPKYFYIDIIPYKPILLPYYTKGIDFWVYGGMYDITYVYTTVLLLV